MSQTKAQLVGGVGISTVGDLTVYGGVNVSGVLTASSFVGAVSGDATGLTGTPNITVGFITATGASISGNVSIGGTLTYEDVTNVDSVGLITARSGINISGGSLVIDSGDISVSGVVTATNYVSLSDENLKENIQTIDNALEKVKNIRGVSFDWRKDSTPSMGVVAQELQEVLPELVTSSDPKTVNYDGIIAVLIEAIKELENRIVTLESHK